MNTSRKPFLPLVLTLAAFAVSLPAADVYKLNVNSALNVTTAWSTGVLPGTADTAVWDSRITTAGNNTNNPGANASWLGIRIANPVVPVTITNGGTLRTITLGSGGIDMNSPTSTVDFVINCQLVAGQAQTWNVKPGRVLHFGTNSGGPASIIANADLTPVGYFRIGRTLDVNSNSTLSIADGTTLEFTSFPEAVLRVGNQAQGGTVVQTGGLVKLARSGTTRNVLILGNAALTGGAVGTYRLSGGVVDGDDVGDYLVSIANVANAPGEFHVTGNGRLYSAQLNVGFRTNGLLAIRDDGFVQAMTKFQLAGSSGAVVGYGTVDLNGGTLVTTNMTRGGGAGTALFNFNGGLLRPLTSNPSFVDSSGNPAVPIQLQVQSGGARIDTSGFSIGINHPLLHAGTSPDGGLTKLGAGTLALSGTNTYDGPTLVSEGRLLLSPSAVPGAGLTVAGSATLGVQLSAAGETLVTPALVLGQGAGDTTTNEINLGPFGSPLNPVIDAAALAVQGTVRVAISGFGLSVGTFPVYRYGTASGVGSATFVLESLPAGVVATLQHNPGSKTIDLVVTTVPALVWSGQVDNNWDTSTLNWLDGGTAASAAFFNGAAVRFDDDALLTLVYVTGAYAPGRVTVSNQVAAYHFTGSGSLGGGGVFIKEGAAPLTLAISNATWGGNTEIRAGRVLLGAPDALPDGAGRGNLLLNGQLDLAGGFEGINGLSGSGVVENSAATPAALTVGNNNAPGSFSGRIQEVSGPIALSKAGAGSQALTSPSAYSGGTTSLAGTLQVGHDSALGTGVVEMRGGTLATLGGARTLANPVAITAGAPGFDTSAGDLTLTGPLTDAGGFDPVKLGEGSLILKGGQYFVPGGGFNVNRGRLVVDGCSATNTDDGIRLRADSGSVAELVVTNDGIFSMGALMGGTPNFRMGNLAQGASTNILSLVSGQVLLEGSSRELLVGDLAATIGIVRQTGGSLRWMNNNSSNISLLLGSNATAQGSYELAGGNLVAPRVRRGAGIGTFHFNGGTLSPSTNFYLTNFMEGLTLATIGDGGAVIDSAGWNMTVAQPLLAAGTGGLTKRGMGSLILAGTNTYSGSTVVEEGLVHVTTAGFAGGGEVQLLNFGGLNVTLSAPGQSLVTKALRFDAIDSPLNVQLASFGNPVSPVIIATNLSANGFCTINLAGAGLAPGQFPLIRYTGTIGGAGFSRFILGTVPVGVEAALVDNAANQSVDILILSSVPLVWTGATDSNWDNLGTPNWDFFGFALGYTDGASVRFDDYAWGSTAVNLTVPLQPALVTVSNGVLPNYTFGGPGRISGLASLTKEGGGSLVISNDNDFAGPVRITGGTLVAAHSNALGSAVAGTTVSGGGTLDVFANIFNRERLTVSGDGVGGRGAIVNNGAGQQQNATRFVTLAGDTTFGAEQRWDIRAASGTTNAVLSSGGQPHRLAKVGTNHIAFVSVQVDAALGEIDIKEGGLGYELFTTSLGDPARLMTIRSNAWLRMYQSANPLNKSVRLEDGGQLQATSGTSNVVTGPILVPGGLGQIGASASVTLVVSNQISGAGGVRKTLPGTTTLAVPNSYAGPTVVESGILAVSADDRLGQAGSDVILNGGTLQAPVGFTLEAARPVYLGYGSGGTGTVQVVGGTMSYGGVVADYPGGPGQLIKNGAGILELSGANTFSGGSLIQAGTLALAHDSGLGTGLITLNAATLATAGGARTVSNPLAISGGTVTFDASAGDLVLQGLLTNFTAGDPRKTGAGALVFRGGFSFGGGAGWDIVRGLMVLDGNASTNADDGYRIGAEDGALAGLVVTNGGLFVLGSSGGTPNLRLGNVASTGTNVLVLHSGEILFDLRAAELLPGYGAGTTSLVHHAGGTMRWIGTNVAAGINMSSAAGSDATYQFDGGTLIVPRIRQVIAASAGRFFFNGGTLMPSTNLNANTFMQGLTEARIQDGGATIDTAGLNITIGQALLNGGSGGLRKIGAGQLTLTNVSTYVGLTRVEAGSLVLTGAASIAASTTLSVGGGATLAVDGVAGGFTLASGQTLSGNGTVSGPVSVSPGAVLDPGEGLGTLTLTASPALAGTVAHQVGRIGGVTVSDTLIINGSVVLGGELRVTLAAGSSPLQNGDVFNLLDATSISGSFASVNLPSLPAGLAWDTTQLAVDGTLRVTASSGGGPTIAVADPGNGSLIVGCPGLPGEVYVLERTFSLAPPAVWVPQLTNAVPLSGLLLFTNTPVPPATFYRTRRAP